MEYKELLLKAAFCTMACDGDIAEQELQCVRIYAEKFNIGELINVEEPLNNYVAEINTLKQVFLNNFIKELSEQNLNEEQELQLVKVLVDMIMADEVIEYSEVKFFKRIRSNLSITDEQIREILPKDSDDPNVPTKDDFLAQDIIVADDAFWEDITFDEIKLEINTI